MTRIKETRVSYVRSLKVSCLSRQKEKEKQEV
jgi:hypothetical protein